MVHNPMHTFMLQIYPFMLLAMILQVSVQLLHNYDVRTYVRMLAGHARFVLLIKRASIVNAFILQSIIIHNVVN